ncbi:30975_t:CDS:2, partial [Gigaspora margarita]
WVNFYSKPWIKASLNPAFSCIDINTWYMTPDNTNVAESCHANINRNGKALSLYNAILKAKQYDEQHFITCNIQNNYGISNSGKNQSIIAREKHLTEDSASQISTSLNHQEYQLTLKERELAIKERELKLEKEKLELEKLQRELSLNGL